MTIITETELSRSTGTIWSSLLAIDLAPGSPAPPNGPMHVGCINITGGWVGAIEIACATSAARAFSACMLQTDGAGLADSDIDDAFGELANLVAGQIKAQLRGPAQLSVPVVISGMKLSISMGRCRVLCRTDLVGAGHHLTVTLYAQD
jgi:CheY-specific phosphatase CheX